MKAWLEWLLSRPVWQGVAGTAQGIAAILALVAVWQARQMLRQADESRRASVAPDWVITNDPTRVQGLQVALVDILLQNVGFGPACNFSTEFESKNGRHQNCIRQSSNERGANIPSILQNDTLHIGLDLRRHEGPLSGDLVVKCDSLLGDKIVRRYTVEGDAQARSFRITS